MKNEEPSPESSKEQAQGSRKVLNPDSDRRLEPDHEYDVKDLTGKTDSGPEPDVFGQEIPPQDN